MSDQIPPPGPERDAEIARLLDPADHAIREWIEAPQRPLPRSLRRMPPPYSTDPAACDRLVEEMVRRGWWVTVESQPNGEVFASAHRGYDYDVMIDAHTTNGTARPAAVSAASLLALRGGA